MKTKAGIFLYASIMSAAATAASEPKQVEWQSYSRSGPGVEAALYAKGTSPALGAAHQLSLSSTLSSTVSADTLWDLTLYGPWLTEDSLSNNAQQLIRQIQEAGIHGLNPNAYELSQILRTVEALTLLDRPDTHADTETATVHLPGTSNLRESFSQLMNVAFIRLSTHLGQGVVDARSTQNKLFRDTPIVDADSLLGKVSNGLLSVNDAIDSVSPQQPEYKRLTQRMRNLLTERATGIERTKVQAHGDLNAREIADDIISVKLRLLETGDLQDSSEPDSIFDNKLVEALELFQARHGLPVTGALSQTTRDALNHDVDNDITALALSLERWRWMPRDLGKKHVFVNIPDYRVEVKDDNNIVLSMVTVVGAVEHQTPSFSRDMSYLEFNPTWTVPAKIANNELIPKERRNPGYLASRQFIFLERVNNRLVRVPSSQVTRKDFNSSWFPYVLQQKGGPINALGRIKFMLPNPYAIYLHDTQAKKHFTLNDRAFSHGCIRLSDPDRLAVLLMREDGYEQSQITDALSSDRTTRIRLREPVPTHLTYITSWVDDNNKLHRRADVYSHNEALEQGLLANNTLISTLRQDATEQTSGTLFASGE